ncbi:MAG: ABC transporter substrate-binding protein [Rhizobiaceae bacterium]|nr:ABC transporter substrate-binding protein [Rhizobiaceae bacterium]
MKRFLTLVFFMLWPATAEAADFSFPATGEEQSHLTIGSTTDIGVIRTVISAFQAANPGIAITYREETTRQLYVEAQEACAGNRQADDLVISSAMDLQVKLVNDGCASQIAATALAALPDHARWRDELFGLTYEPAVIVYNRKLIAPSEAPLDHIALADLLRQPDRFNGKIGTYDIEQSGVGYLFATFDATQSSTWGRLIEGMGRNSVQLFCCTSDVLDRVADGRLTIGYNVLGSYALAEAARYPDMAIVVPSDYALVLSRAAFIPVGAANAADALKFLEFTQSPEGRTVLDRDAKLFSPVNGAERLLDVAGMAENARQSLRPIPLGTSLLIGLDAMKRRQFLKLWRESLATGRD